MKYTEIKVMLISLISINFESASIVKLAYKSTKKVIENAIPKSIFKFHVNFDNCGLIVYHPNDR